MDKNYNYPSGQITIPPFIEKEGIFDVVLNDKMWGYKTNLICVFETDTGEIFSVTAWRRKSRTDPDAEIYSPKKSEEDFKYISRGTKWRCTFKLSRNGKYYDWMDASPILE